MTQPSSLLDGLMTGGRAPAFALVVAHPDDETIGAGARLGYFRDALFIFLTDGAPRDGTGSAAAEAQRIAYARTRRSELSAALACAGIAPRVEFLGCIDQEASFALPTLAICLSELLADRDAVLTHPYEGGHPDHDAAAWAVHLACRRLRRAGAKAPTILEMTSYHATEGGLEIGRFLPRSESAEAAVVLSADEQRDKRELLSCYASQQSFLKCFPVDVERFRAAPPYNFNVAPHAGSLYYETQNWRMSGALWRNLARAAEQEILC